MRVKRDLALTCAAILTATTLTACPWEEKIREKDDAAPSAPSSPASQNSEASHDGEDSEAGGGSGDTGPGGEPTLSILKEGTLADPGCIFYGDDYPGKIRRDSGLEDETRSGKMYHSLAGSIFG